MRVISGKFRNKPLKTLEGLSTRPTTSRVKESIFNIVQFDIQDSQVLDLFSGTGQMGIECLSRGAKAVDFVDSSKPAVAIIEKNLKSCGIISKVYQNDYITFIKSTKNKYNLIFLDPPYSTNDVNISINLINRFKLLKECGIIVCETHVDDKIEIEDENIYIHKVYKYGSTNVTIIKANQ